MKENKVKEVANLLGKHEETIKRCGQVNSLTLIEIAIKKGGELLNLIY
ncbi:hypothetical protein ACIQXF_00130 [Lysinibacillus sp. NPDC097231]